MSSLPRSGSPCGCALPGGGQIKDVRKVSRVEPFADPSDAGVCIAKAQLFGTLTAVPVIPFLGPNEATLWSAKADPALPHGMLVGCVLEFDVVLPAGSWFHFRTVASLSPSSFGGADDTPYPPGSHVRGWWDKSRLELHNAQDFDCDPTRLPTEENPSERHLAICEGSGAEHGPTGFAAMPGAGIPGDPHEFDLLNRGCYGVDLEYVKGLYNENTTLSNNAYLHIVSRNIGQKFWGAAQVVEPPGSDGDKQGVPKLEPATGSGKLQRELVQLLEARIPARITVPANTPASGAIPTRVRVAVGGASATPANIHYSCEQLTYTDVEDPA